MGMGRFNANKQYNQQNPMGNAGALMGLLRDQGKAFQGVSTAMDNYGQSRARGALAELMGSGQLDGKTPQEQQALAQGATGGRTLGKEGQKTLADMLGLAEATQKINAKEDAATTLFGRQNSQIAQRFNNAKTLKQVSKDAETTKESGFLDKLNKLTEEISNTKSRENAYDPNNMMPKEDFSQSKQQTTNKILSLLQSSGASKTISEGILNNLIPTSPVTKNKASPKLTSSAAQTLLPFQKALFNQGKAVWDSGKKALVFPDGTVASEANVKKRFPNWKGN